MRLPELDGHGLSFMLPIMPLPRKLANGAVSLRSAARCPTVSASRLPGMPATTDADRQRSIEIAKAIAEATKRR